MAIVFQIQSFIILLIMTIGVYQKRNRDAHVQLMTTSIVWDIALIFQIELSRGAIMKASEAMTNHQMLNIHVALAVSCVLFYFGMIYSGRKLLAGDNSIRNKHKIAGITTYMLRWSVFITSFYAIKG